MGALIFQKNTKNLVNMRQNVHSFRYSTSYKFCTFGSLELDTYLLSLSSLQFSLQINARRDFHLSFAFFRD